MVIVPVTWSDLQALFITRTNSSTNLYNKDKQPGSSSNNFQRFSSSPQLGIYKYLIWQESSHLVLFGHPAYNTQWEDAHVAAIIGMAVPEHGTVNSPSWCVCSCLAHFFEHRLSTKVHPHQCTFVLNLLSHWHAKHETCPVGCVSSSVPFFDATGRVNTSAGEETISAAYGR